MGIVNHDFATEKEAKAFRAGVEYVNDSCCQVLRIEHDENQQDYPWIVVCQDDDL